MKNRIISPGDNGAKAELPQLDSISKHFHSIIMRHAASNRAIVPDSAGLAAECARSYIIGAEGAIDLYRRDVVRKLAKMDMDGEVIAAVFTALRGAEEKR